MKPYATYGKKPRGSKTSKREVVNGIPLFLHFGQATGKAIIAYHDKPPYPRVTVFAGDSYWDCKDKLVAWFKINSLDVQLKLDTLDKNFGMDKDIIDKAVYDSNKYNIYEEHPHHGGFPYLSLVTVPLDDNKFLYLWVNNSEAPTVKVKNKIQPDVHVIHAEYLKRQKNKAEYGNIIPRA